MTDRPDTPREDAPATPAPRRVNPLNRLYVPADSMGTWVDREDVGDRQAWERDRGSNPHRPPHY